MHKITIVQCYMHAMKTWNIAEAASFLADDVVLSIGGKHQLSGVHKGKGHFFEMFQRMLRLTQFTYRLHEQIDCLESATRVILITRESAERNRQRYYFNRVTEYCFCNETIGAVNIYEASPEITDGLFVHLS